MTQEEKQWLEDVDNSTRSGKPIPHNMVDTVHQLIAKVRELDEHLHGISEKVTEESDTNG